MLLLLPLNFPCCCWGVWWHCKRKLTARFDADEERLAARLEMPSWMATSTSEPSVGRQTAETSQHPALLITAPAKLRDHLAGIPELPPQQPGLRLGAPGVHGSRLARPRHCGRDRSALVQRWQLA